MNFYPRAFFFKFWNLYIALHIDTCVCLNIYILVYLYFFTHIHLVPKHINEKQIKYFLLIFRLDWRNNFLVYTGRNLPVSVDNNVLDNFISSFRKPTFLKAYFCTSCFYCLFANYRCKIASLLLLGDWIYTTCC